MHVKKFWFVLVVALSSNVLFARKHSGVVSTISWCAEGMKLGSQKLQSYAMRTALFYYDGLITKRCSKKKQKKAYKNFVWYRNLGVLAAGGFYAKYKINQRVDRIHATIDRHVSQIQLELEPSIIKTIETQTPFSRQLQAAIAKRIILEIQDKPIPEVEELKRLIVDKIMHEIQSISIADCICKMSNTVLISFWDRFTHKHEQR